MSAMKFILGGIMIVALIYALRLGELYTQVGRYQAFWTRSNQIQTTKQAYTYIALGDSTAQGIGASRPVRGYVGLIADYLRQQSSQEVNIVNLSKSGATLDDALLEQIPEMKRLKITNDTVITVEIGANDMIDFNPRKFEKNFEKILAELPKQTIVSNMPSFSGSRLSRLDKNAVKANKIIDKLTHKHGFKTADVHSNTLANHGLRTFAPDLFHPSDYGYSTNWAPAFINQLKKRASND